jgi:hypothetical protein
VAGRLRKLTAVAGLVLAGVALLAAVKQLPHSLRVTQAQVSTNAGQTRVQRELEPARAYGMHQDLAVRAAEVLPRHAVYYVATAGQPAAAGAESFYAYYLLPRRRTLDVHDAGWVVSWGADPKSLGVPTRVVADLGGGAEVLEVER